MGDIEELIDLVLTGQHPKLRERCIVDRIVSVLDGAECAAATATAADDDCARRAPRAAAADGGGRAASRSSARAVPSLGGTTGGTGALSRRARRRPWWDASDLTRASAHWYVQYCTSTCIGQVGW